MALHDGVGDGGVDVIIAVAVLWPWARAAFFSPAEYIIFDAKKPISLERLCEAFMELCQKP